MLLIVIGFGFECPENNKKCPSKNEFMKTKNSENTPKNVIEK